MDTGRSSKAAGIQGGAGRHVGATGQARGREVDAGSNLLGKRSLHGACPDSADARTGPPRERFFRRGGPLSLLGLALKDHSRRLLDYHRDRRARPTTSAFAAHGAQYHADFSLARSRSATPRSAESPAMAAMSMGDSVSRGSRRSWLLP